MNKEKEKNKMENETVLWRHKVVPISEFVELPKNVVVLGIDYCHEDGESDYLDYLVLATDAEVRMHRASEEYDPDAYEAAYKDVQEERKGEDDKRGELETKRSENTAKLKQKLER